VALQILRRVVGAISDHERPVRVGTGETMNHHADEGPARARLARHAHASPGARRLDDELRDATHGRRSGDQPGV
jgi:hypothetical protein